MIEEEYYFVVGEEPKEENLNYNSDLNLILSLFWVFSVGVGLFIGILFNFTWLKSFMTFYYQLVLCLILIVGGAVSLFIYYLWRNNG